MRYSSYNEALDAAHEEISKTLEDDPEFIQDYCSDLDESNSVEVGDRHIISLYKAADKKSATIPNDQIFAYALVPGTLDKAIGNFITNDPQHLRDYRNKLLTVLYPKWLADDERREEVWEDYDAWFLNDNKESEIEDVMKKINKEKPLMVKVYLDDVGLIKSTELVDSDVTGNFPSAVYVVTGDSEDVSGRTIVTDTKAKGQKYIKDVMDDNGVLTPIKVGTEPTDIFTYIPY